MTDVHDMHPCNGHRESLVVSSSCMVVFVLEDDQLLSDLLVEVLTDRGFQVKPFGSIDDLLEATNNLRVRPALIVADAALIAMWRGLALRTWSSSATASA